MLLGNRIDKLVCMVVDDFEPMRKVTGTQLRNLGIERVVYANNGSEALKLLDQQKIDVVISDWNMPVMTGLELLKELRGSERYWNMPFVMITAEAERERVREAIANGISDLLVKPYSPDRLQNAIDKALAWRMRRKTRETSPEAQAVEPVAMAPVSNTVAVSAPANTVETVAMAPVAVVPRQAERASILIVDDEPTNLQLLSQLFKDTYRIRIAHNGRKALEICHSATPPDLVLLDVMMPEMDGFEVALKMREHPNSQTIPIIFVTAMGEDASRQKGMELGAVDYVTKPIDPEQLTLRVSNFLRYVELHKQLQADYDTMLEMEHLKEEVAHMTRHDIKGPLAGVIGILQTLQKNDTLNELQQEQVDLAIDTTMQVISMINLTAELYKIETGNFVLRAKPIDLIAQLNKIVDLMRASFASKKLIIAINTDIPMDEIFPDALGDEMLSYSVFQNLVKNACEAAPEKSRIVVSLKSLDQIKADAPLEIAVSNTGVVPEEIRSYFFKKYVTFGKKGGTGIGAYSAKLLTEAQNGSIDFSVSDEENTTTICVKLPRAEAAGEIKLLVK
ncbi:response regulator [Chitinibacter sp. S2-10]|uniref:ATP-binding response regulator n=1 Tax=Chitinibacter sp. S2-10 TaxID=3373597 RepID=UPI0039778040